MQINICPLPGTAAIALFELCDSLYLTCRERLLSLLARQVIATKRLTFETLRCVFISGRLGSAL